jgi:hypothetical protein
MQRKYQPAADDDYGFSGTFTWALATGYLRRTITGKPADDYPIF